MYSLNKGPIGKCSLLIDKYSLFNSRYPFNKKRHSYTCILVLHLMQCQMSNIHVYHKIAHCLEGSSEFF